jgi:hypothetical protein
VFTAGRSRIDSNFGANTQRKVCISPATSRLYVKITEEYRNEEIIVLSNCHDDHRAFGALYIGAETAQAQFKQTNPSRTCPASQR